jgi:flagellar capping protein FliD
VPDTPRLLVCFPEDLEADKIAQRRMRMKSLLAALLFLTGILTSAFGEAIVTLKSGEILQGDILSDTNNVVEMRAYTHNRTISSRRKVPRSEIQNIQNETPAQAAERVAYSELSKFRLNPDQEQTTGFYNQWILAFERFLTEYPNSDKAPIFKQRIETCVAELKHMAKGEVKFENKWMTPVEKKPQALKKELAQLERRRNSLQESLEKSQVQLDGLHTKLDSLVDGEEPVYETYVDDSQNHYAHRVYVGTRRVANENRPYVQKNIVSCQESIVSGRSALASLDANIQNIKIEIPKAEQEFRVALYELNNPKQSIVQVPPSPPQPSIQLPPPPTPKVEPTPPWYKRLWNWL